MAEGGGKYEQAAELVRTMTGASTVVLIIEGGMYGGGFTVASDDMQFTARLPVILEAMAAEIRRDMEGAGHEGTRNN
jgi:hypothetical protein